MYMGVIPSVVVEKRFIWSIPHVYGGDPFYGNPEIGWMGVFPMYMGVIP